jgi:hypothetical protein
MSKKNLPIKIFNKRKEIDERRIEGGGSKKLPKFVLTRDELQLKSNAFINTIESNVSTLNNRKPERKFIPTTLRLEVNDKAIAKSHRSEIKSIFNVGADNSFIGFHGDNNLLVKIDSVEDANKIKENLKKIDQFKIGLSALNDIESFEPRISIDEKSDHEIKVKLLNYQDSELNNAVERVFEELCESNQLIWKKTNYSPDLIIFKIENANKTVIDKIEEFEALESISFMPQFKIGLDFVDSDESLEIKEPDPNITYPTVGVLDSGISNNKYFKPWLLSKSYSAYPESRIDRSHGTFVAGIILYGDELEKKTISGLAGCKLFDATVMPDLNKESITEDELVENIREAIQANRDIKIWNMSLGSRQESDKYNFSDFGQALDSIQEINEVVICKSAGNCANFIKAMPKSRVARSADSILSLVVGSIAHSKNKNDIAEINNPSPFSRMGRGPANIIKPELVSYGGNAGSVGGKMTKNGVNSISIGGQVVSEIGTSFSTPRISALLASLDVNIKEAFNPLLLKSLAIHSAKYPKELNMSMPERLKHVGFGVPAPSQEIIYNDEYEITLILQDTLVKGEYLEILEFPFPDSMVDDEGYFYGHVNLTMVSAPVLRNQGSEYCQSNLEVTLGTYDNIKNRDTNLQTVLNEIGPEGAENVLRDSAYKASYKKNDNHNYAGERVLLNYGRKYQPIKKYSVDLSELTPANKDHKLKAPKKWFLRVKGLYREFTEEMAKEDGEELSQDFSLVLTIKDPMGQNKVYNEVNQLLATRNFNHSNIRINDEVHIENK